MRTTDDVTVAATDPGASWSRLLTGDAPNDWAALVEQIAWLEELLGELDAEGDTHAMYAAATLRDVLVARRRSLHALDVG